MAIENVVMMDVIGKIKDVDNFARDIFLFNEIQIVDAMNEIDIGRFILPISEENIGELLGFSQLVSGETIMDEKKYVSMANKLKELYQDELKVDKAIIAKNDCSIEKALDYYQTFDQRIALDYHDLEEMKNKLAILEKSRQAYSHLDELTVPMAELDNMENFAYSLGSVTKDNASRLKGIYNSVTSILFHVGNQDNNEEVFMIISPKDLKIESDRILKALNFKTIEGLDPKYTKSPKENLKEIIDEMSALQEEYDQLSLALNVDLKKNRETANETFNIIALFANLEVIKKNMAFSEENFYFSGWISKKDKKRIQAILAKYSDMIVMFSDSDEGIGKTPTKLRNNWLVRPFESLVKMYGTPSYNELDPTLFLSLSYLFCFGFMFGDVGQGLVLVLGGFLLAKKGLELGKVLIRLGIVSTFFGFIYGSVFGLEEVIGALWIRPFEEVNQLLITAILIGVGLLLIAYLYSIVNKLRQKDYKEGLFGKNGLSGLVLYASILGILAINVLNLEAAKPFIPILVTLALVIVFLVLIREPLANFLFYKKALYDESASEYYVESGFELFEMFLAMFSNTVSFIRIGAFALVHVALFMAFQTLAAMTASSFAQISILVIANIFIIALEGLIVFIQALRLQYYELFSKYYTGEGDEFKPVNLDIKLF